MLRIEGSVGQGGDNLSPDVRIVQQALNRHDLTPLTALGDDGRCSAATIEAIRHFQTRHLNMTSPDGRVDPGGRTQQRLGSQTSGRGTGGNAETRKADRGLRAERVDPRVQETAVTTRIIDALVPRFGTVRAIIIGGYLSDSDQFWKVDYHWEYLLDMVVHSLSLPVQPADTSELESIRSTLRACSPDPPSGYTSSPIGKPEDRSTPEEVSQRHTVLRGAKERFAAITRSADLLGRSKRSPTMFDLAAAPVAAPGKSKHGTGYALDIQGDNGAIKSLCTGLGATLAFDEKSHVHVEFKNGLAPP